MDHDHDDGLVHSHGWAMEPPPSIGMLLRPANDTAATPPDIAAAMNSKQDHEAGLRQAAAAEERRRA